MFAVQKIPIHGDVQRIENAEQRQLCKKKTVE